jgi:hypothetical protein
MNNESIRRLPDDEHHHQHGGGDVRLPVQHITSWFGTPLPPRWNKSQLIVEIG